MVPFGVPEPLEAASLFQKSLLVDNGQFLLDCVHNEDVDPLMKQFFSLLKVCKGYLCSARPAAYFVRGVNTQASSELISHAP